MNKEKIIKIFEEHKPNIPIDDIISIEIKKCHSCLQCKQIVVAYEDWWEVYYFKIRYNPITKQYLII